MRQKQTDDATRLKRLQKQNVVHTILYYQVHAEEEQRNCRTDEATRRKERDRLKDGEEEKQRKKRRNKTKKQENRAQGSNSS